MAASQSPGSNFTMHGAREAVANGMRHVEEQVNAIERAVDEQPSLVFDLARTIVESSCRTILTERNTSYNARDDLPALFRTVTKNLPLLPATASGEAKARSSLTQTLNGLHNALQGVCELRNEFGFASHGSDGRQARLEANQAMLAAQAADTIVGFLSRVHSQDRALLPEVRLQYDQQPDFNEHVDSANEISRIFSFEYSASEVLFYVDNDAYRTILREFSEEDIDPVEDDAGIGGAAK